MLTCLSSAIKTVGLQTAGSGSTSPGGLTGGSGHEAGGIGEYDTIDCLNLAPL